MGACRESGRRFFVHYFILNTYQNKEFIGFRDIGTGIVLCGQETDLSTRSQDFFLKNVSIDEKIIGHI